MIPEQEPCDGQPDSQRPVRLIPADPGERNAQIVDNVAVGGAPFAGRTLRPLARGLFEHRTNMLRMAAADCLVLAAEPQAFEAIGARRFQQPVGDRVVIRSIRNNDFATSWARLSTTSARLSLAHGHRPST